jgi:hypothetical protein
MASTASSGAVVWQIAQEEVPLLEEQAVGILRAEFPDLAKTCGPDAGYDRSGVETDEDPA